MTKYFSFIKFFNQFDKYFIDDLDDELNSDKEFNVIHDISTKNYTSIYMTPIPEKYLLFVCSDNYKTMKLALIDDEQYNQIYNASGYKYNTNQQTVENVLESLNLKYTSLYNTPELEIANKYYIDRFDKPHEIKSYLHVIKTMVMFRTSNPNIDQIAQLLNNGTIETSNKEDVYKIKPTLRLKKAKNKAYMYLSMDINILYNVCVECLNLIKRNYLNDQDRLKIKKRFRNIAYMCYRTDKLNIDRLNNLHVMLYKLTKDFTNTNDFYDYLKRYISHEPYTEAYTEDLANLLLESVQIIENANKIRLAKEPIKLNFMQYDTHPLRDDKDVKFDVVFNETSAIWK